MWQYTETEEEVKHGEDEDAELVYEEMLLACGAITETKAMMEERLGKEAIAKAIAEEKLKVEMSLVVCSCGSPRCNAIKTFGLVKPTFLAHVEPIGCQMTRDQTALRIRMQG